MRDHSSSWTLGCPNGMAFFLNSMPHCSMPLQGSAVGVHQFHKSFVNAPVIREFRMEGCRHELALPDQRGMPVALCEYFDLRPGFNDAWSTNKNHFEFVSRKFGIREENGGVDLAPVCVSLNHSIQQTQAPLCRITNFARQQDRPRTGSEDRLSRTEVLQLVEEMAAVKKFQDGSGFAPGENQSVQFLQLLTLAYFHRSCARVEERLGVGGVVPLYRKNSNARARRFHFFSFPNWPEKGLKT